MELPKLIFLVDFNSYTEATDNKSAQDVMTTMTAMEMSQFLFCQDLGELPRLGKCEGGGCVPFHGQTAI